MISNYCIGKYCCHVSLLLWPCSKVCFILYMYIYLRARAKWLLDKKNCFLLICFIKWIKWSITSIHGWRGQYIVLTLTCYDVIMQRIKIHFTTLIRFLFPRFNFCILDIEYVQFNREKETKKKNGHRFVVEDNGCKYLRVTWWLIYVARRMLYLNCTKQ